MLRLEPRLAPAAPSADARSRRDLEEEVRLLRQREEYYRCLLENTSDFLALLGPEGSIRYVSPSLTRGLGYRPEELVGRNAFDFVHPDDLREVLDLFQVLIAEPLSRKIAVHRFRHHDGSWRTLETSATNLLDYPAVQGVTINSRDVTERLAAEGAIRASERRLKLAQQIAGLGSWEWDPANDHMACSDELCRLYGIDPRDLDREGMVPFRAIVAEDRDAVLAAMEDTVQNGSVFEAEYRVRRPDGAIRIIHSRGEVLPGNGATALRVFGTVLDVTERHRAEQELRHLLDRVQESDRLKSAFLANMSHEVRTPLNVILGYNQLISAYAAELGDHRQQELVSGVDRASHRLVTTIQQILDLSRIETGTFQLRPTELRLSDVLDSQVAMTRGLAAEKGLSVSYENGACDALVRFDPDCLAGAVRILLNNAVKFTLQGTIEVRVTQEPGGSLRLAIRDSGVGIDPAYLPQVFQPFSQEASGNTRPFEGAGLGLALARRYVEMNDARLTVESEKTKGSVFTIEVSPASTRTGPAGDAPSGGEGDRTKGGGARPVVLVVEDDPETQAYMRTILSSRYEVLVASSGGEARRHLGSRGDELRVVLMDISLKGSEDGLALTRFIRSEDRWKDLPVIATTAHAFAEDRENALNAGCTAYLAKPFDHRQLIALMDRLVRARS